jgi:hypothetical protein
MIQHFADWLVYGIFGLDATTPLGTAVNFWPIAQIAGWNVLQSLMCTGDLSDSNV